MRTDVLDMREFYARPLGRAARHAIGDGLERLWGGSMSGLTLAGYGYASPFLGFVGAGAARMINLMPEAQGVAREPRGQGAQAALVEEAHWPLPDASVDRVLIAHGLEEAESAQRLLREAWRVLTDDGRILIVAANRASPWAFFDHTPFGSGQPYSRAQLSRLLRGAMFAPDRWTRALHYAPLPSRTFLKSARFWERVGRRVWPGVSGVLMVEASKELIIGAPAHEAAWRRVGARARRRLVAPSR